MVIANVDWAQAAYHSLRPEIPDAEALLISVGIIGATVMPHAIYLHSGLTQARTPGRNEQERRMLVRISNHEVVIALAIAGLVNMAMVMMASSAFHAGHPTSPKSKRRTIRWRPCSASAPPACSCCR